MSQQGSPAKDNNTIITNPDAEILEQGDIYFFYRPKKDAQEVKGIEDVRRFFMVIAPEKRKAGREGGAKEEQEDLSVDSSKTQLYRLFVIGKKSLPEVRKTEARASEKYWARVGGIFRDANELTKELLSDEFRKGDAARPVGEGKYAIVRHQNHTELAYVLEMPNEPGEAQKELGIEKEASYIISVINPKIPKQSNLPATEEPPKYPQEVLNEFNETENFVPLSNDTKLIDYQNAQIILVGAREGRDVIKSEIGIEIKEEQSSADIFNKLKLRREQVPIKPLTEGKLE